jgi:hypothetical protein
MELEMEIVRDLDLDTDQVEVDDLDVDADADLDLDFDAVPVRISIRTAASLIEEFRRTPFAGMRPQVKTLLPGSVGTITSVVAAVVVPQATSPNTHVAVFWNLKVSKKANSPPWPITVPPSRTCQ